jgi:hypothetical protein
VVRVLLKSLLGLALNPTKSTHDFGKLFPEPNGRFLRLEVGLVETVEALAQRTFCVLERTR